MSESDGRDLLGKWAIVTGASSGLGADFAEILAGRGCCLVIVARRADRLEELRTRLEGNGVKIHVLALDLSQRGAAAEVHAFTKQHGLVVDFVVNNAGFGKTGRFLESTWEYDESMLNVNVRTLHHLMKLFLPEMVARNEGRILNVASAAGFRPMGNFAAYAATKAYVLHLTEGVHAELADTGVRVSALCPGLTRTEFFDPAKSSGLMRWATMPSLPVARAGIELMLRGDAFLVAGWLNRAMIFLGRFLPRRWVAASTMRFLEEDAEE
jgi:short-subunit dehydrogenase